MAPRIIAIANWKGGSGKTSTSVNLAASIAMQGKKTLVIDLDPQAHSTLSLGILPFNLQNTIYELLKNNFTSFSVEDLKNEISKYIRKVTPENLFLIPATKRLVNIEVDLFQYAKKEELLKNIISNISDQFDFIFFDCPPSLGLLTMNALYSASEVMIPMQTHFLALEGLAQMVEAVSRISKTQNKDLKITGIIPVMTNLNTRLAKEVLSEIKKHFGEDLILTPIRNDIKIAEAPSHRKPLCLYAPSSRGNEDYCLLAQQVLEINNVN